MKISSLVRADFPFAPSRFPFFYGWWILVVTTVGIMSSIPGQTMGVGVYTDYLILHTGLNRLEISMAYMTGTILSSLLLPAAGRLYDLWGSRVMIFLAGTGLGLALLLFSETVWVLKKLELLVPGIPRTTLGLFLMILTFLMLRQFGQGIMSMVSRNTLAKWFDRKRGLASGISGLFVAFSFSGAPLMMNTLIDGFGYPGSMVLMALVCGFGMAMLGWLFFRNQPEDCGLLMDGKTPSADKETPLTSEREVPLSEALRSYNFWIFCSSLCSSSMIVTGFTFHISSIGNLAGLSRFDAYSVFLPMSVFSVVSHFIAGWASDRMPLKYLLMLLVGCLGLGSLGLLAYEELWGRWLVIAGYGIQGGLWGCLSIVAWPRFYGRKHLGEINGVFMGAQVFASAIGPLLFGAAESLSGSYDQAAWISIVGNFLLLLGATKAVSYYRPSNP